MEVDMQKILSEAKLKYPIGCKVKSLFHKNNPILQINKDDFEITRNTSIHVHAESSAYLAVVYENGIWAPIVDEFGNPLNNQLYEIY